LINETLVFVEKPALSQFLVLYAVQEDAAYASRRVTQIFHGDERAE